MCYSLALHAGDVLPFRFRTCVRGVPPSFSTAPGDNRGRCAIDLAPTGPIGDDCGMKTHSASRRTSLVKFVVVVLAGLAACGAVHASVLPDPGNLSSYASAKGQVVHFEVVGLAIGNVWGTDIYTLDSTLAAAAVHAGVLKAGEKGIVQVTILAAQQSFTGSARNGVTSANWGPYDGGYRVEPSSEKLDPAVPAKDPGTLASYARALGQEFQFEVTGAPGGSLWGTDLYTLDSSLAATAVHAGVLKSGERGVVKVTILAGQPAYAGSVRNGITSQNWGSYDGSFRVEKGTLALPPAEKPTVPETLAGYTDKIGNEFKFDVTGSTAGSVWGTDYYTLDSSLAAAAVHAGVLKAGEKGAVRVTILAGQQAYKGSERNGVTSQDWGNYGASFRVAKDK